MLSEKLDERGASERSESMRAITFSDLIDPISPKRFFAEVYGKTTAQFAGSSERFAEIFSWDELNRLLGMSSIWSDRSMKLVLDGRELTGPEFCLQTQNRDRGPTLRPDATRVGIFMRQGATLVLDLAERLTPELRAVSDAITMAMGAPVCCNIYCSWDHHPGFPAHFDTTHVFALHISGEKTWRLYDGQFNNPVELDGYHYSSLSRQHHEDAKGEVLREAHMTPGDVLYIPRGQYHDALATDEASLHLSFGVVEATGLDFLGILLRSLSDDPLFRAALPHFDDPVAHRAHLEKLADRLQEIVADPKTSEQAIAHQRQRTLRDVWPEFSLPDREAPTRFRVRALGVDIEPRAEGCAIRHGDEVHTFDSRTSGIVRWIAERQSFLASELARAFEMTPPEAEEMLEHLRASGLIEEL